MALRPRLDCGVVTRPKLKIACKMLGSRLGGVGPIWVTTLPPRIEGAAVQSIGVGADAGGADAGGTGHHGSIGAAQNAAAFGTAQNLPRQKRRVSLDSDIEIVFQRQRDDVLHGEIEIAGADQLFEARRVSQLRRCHDALLHVERVQDRADERHLFGRLDRHFRGLRVKRRRNQHKD